MIDPTTPADVGDGTAPRPVAVPNADVPPVREVRRDTVCREIRLELADWRTRSGGVYDLAADQREALMLPGHLPHWGEFLPDFVIVYATGDPATVPGPDGTPVETMTWSDLRLHVGGVLADAVTRPEYRRGVGAFSASAEWHGLDAILGRLPRKPAAPAWLLALVREHTPWGPLLVRP